MLKHIIYSSNTLNQCFTRNGSLELNTVKKGAHCGRDNHIGIFFKIILRVSLSISATAVAVVFKSRGKFAARTRVRFALLHAVKCRRTRE